MVYSPCRERVLEFREESGKVQREAEKPQERPAAGATRSVYAQNSSKPPDGMCVVLVSSLVPSPSCGFL